MISSINGLNSNYSYSQTTSANSKNLFNKLDEDGDGLLSGSELETFTSNLTEKTGESFSVSDLLSENDSDEDGSISESEFSAMKPKKPAGPPPNMSGMSSMSFMNGSESEDEEESGLSIDLTEYFDSLDTNKDGIVDSDELEAYKSTLTQNSENESISEILNTLDTDANGSITKEEFNSIKKQPPEGQFNPMNFRRNSGMMNGDFSGISKDSQTTESVYDSNSNSLSYYVKNAINSYLCAVAV